MNERNLNILTRNAIELLQQLVSIPSLSKEENNSAYCLEFFLKQNRVPVKRMANNVYCVNKYFDPLKPSILLNSHHDTVAPNSQYSKDPYDPNIKDGKLYGLGTTDAGASLVCLLSAFVFFYEQQDPDYNLVFAGSAEEEISGANGIELLFLDKDFSSHFQHKKSFAIVGEPTQLNLAIAEKGLLVIDCIATGRAGHAAREEGDNAIYKAMEAIEWFKNFRFPKISDWLGEIKMTVTSVTTENKAHNVVPATCNFTADIRVTEMYTHAEILSIIRSKIPEVEIKARSTRLHSSSIPSTHPVVQAGIALGKEIYGSPTLSDQALIPMPSVKCGPGNSAQSHSADEFILLTAIGEGIAFYIDLLDKLITPVKSQRSLK